MQKEGRKRDIKMKIEKIPQELPLKNDNDLKSFLNSAINHDLNEQSTNNTDNL